MIESLYMQNSMCVKACKYMLSGMCAYVSRVPVRRAKSGRVRSKTVFTFKFAAARTLVCSYDT